MDFLLGHLPPLRARKKRTLKSRFGSSLPTDRIFPYSRPERLPASLSYAAFPSSMKVTIPLTFIYRDSLSSINSEAFIPKIYYYDPMVMIWNDGVRVLPPLFIRLMNLYSVSFVDFCRYKHQITFTGQMTSTPFVSDPLAPPSKLGQMYSLIQAVTAVVPFSDAVAYESDVTPGTSRLGNADDLAAIAGSNVDTLSSHGTSNSVTHTGDVDMSKWFRQQDLPFNNRQLLSRYAWGAPNASPEITIPTDSLPQSPVITTILQCNLRPPEAPVENSGIYYRMTITFLLGFTFTAPHVYRD